MKHRAKSSKIKYQRFLRPRFKPFDPLELARETEKIVTRKGKEGLDDKNEQRNFEI